MCWFLHRDFPSLAAPHLWNEQVTWRELSACLLHLAVTLRLKGFQVVAALHHGFHLWLYLVDVETGDGELLLNRAGDLHRLETNEKEEEWEVSRNVVKIECGGGGGVWSMQCKRCWILYSIWLLSYFKALVKLCSSPSAFVLHMSDQRNCNESTDITRPRSPRQKYLLKPNCNLVKTK